MDTPVLSVLTALLCFLVVFWLLAFLEERSAVKLRWKSVHQRRLILWMLGVSVIIVALILLGGAFIWPLMLALKIVVAKFVSDEAGKVGRNKVLWGVLGLVEFHSSLLILFIRPQIVKMVGSSEGTIKGKLEQLNVLFSEGLLNEVVAQERLEKVLSEITNQKQIDRLASTDFDKDRKRELLRKSFKMGLLTQEEFDDKVRAL